MNVNMSCNDCRFSWARESARESLDSEVKFVLDVHADEPYATIETSDDASFLPSLQPVDSLVRNEGFVRERMTYTLQ